MTTARPSGATYRSIDVRRSHAVSSSLSPCSRYSTGGAPVPAVPAKPICSVVLCGRITVIDVLRPRTSEKKSQRSRAIAASSQTEPATGRARPGASGATPQALAHVEVRAEHDLVELRTGARGLARDAPHRVQDVAAHRRPDVVTGEDAASLRGEGVV